jgi:S1-C subfamily serine protease
VRITSLTPALANELGFPVERGVLIIQVMPGTAAAGADIRDNDIVISLSGEDTPDLRTFQQVLLRFRAGDTVELGLVRGSQNITIEVTLGEMPL